MKRLIISALTLTVGFAALHLAGGADAITPPDVPASGSPIVFESGTDRVALVELFTSQGCSSCPPADAFLSRKVRDRNLWEKYVPIAWHVAYWDRLGWPDPFASEKHTRRQHAHHKAGNIASVYTPGFVIDGREWRGFFEHLDLPETGTASGAIPNLKATVEGKAVTVEVTWPGITTTSKAGWTMHMAELGFGLKTEIPLGENSGRTLINDFVALSHQAAALDAGTTKAAFIFSQPEAGAPTPTHRALAIWLTKTGELTPSQATGGWIPTSEK